jgi:hypothetical protein
VKQLSALRHALKTIVKTKNSLGVFLEIADFDDQAIEAHGDPADQTNES